MAFLVKVNDLLSDGNVRFEADAELAPSIKKNGIQVPLQVYRTNHNGTCWYVKDGHRRLMGAVVAGLMEVPCVEVDPPSDRPEQIAQQYIINQHRKGLTQLEKAEVYRRLREDFGWPQKVVAEKFSVSEAEVSLALAALRAHPAIRDAMLEGKLSHSAVEPVLSLESEDQGKIAPLVIQAKTVRKVAEAVKTYRQANGIERGIRTPKVTTPKMPTKSVDPLEAMAVDAIETALQNLKMAESAILSDNGLKERGATAVREILTVAARLKVQLESVVEVDVEEEAFAWEDLQNF